MTDQQKKGGGGFRKLSATAQKFVDDAKMTAKDDGPPERPVEPPEPATTAADSSVEAKMPPAASPQAVGAPTPARKPWEDTSAGGKGVSLPMSPELYAKMVWVTNNVPKMSLQKIARMGAEQLCDKLIAENYKEPGK